MKDGESLSWLRKKLTMIQVVRFFPRLSLFQSLQSVTAKPQSRLSPSETIHCARGRQRTAEQFKEAMSG